MPEYTLKLYRYDPESGDAARWENYEVDLPEARPGLQHEDRPGRRGGHTAQWAERDRRRADGQLPGHQGPDRRHGRGPLEEGAARRPVASPRRAAARARVHRSRRV